MFPTVRRNNDLRANRNVMPVRDTPEMCAARSRENCVCVCVYVVRGLIFFIKFFFPYRFFSFFSTDRRRTGKSGRDDAVASRVEGRRTGTEETEETEGTAWTEERRDGRRRMSH